MSIIRKHIYLYTVIVIIPTIIAAIMYRDYLEEQEIKNVQANSKEVGQLHQQYIETLINQTIKSLDIVSIPAINIVEQPDEMTNLLNQTKKTDKRYENLYFVNMSRIIVAGTTSRYHGIQMPSSYMNSCESNQKTHVSYQKNIGPNQNTFLFICKPVFNERNDAEGYLLAQLRIDYIKNVLELLTPNIVMMIRDNKQNVIFTLNEDLKQGEFNQVIPFKDVPWVLELFNSHEEIFINSDSLLKFVIFFSIVTHLIFFAVQFILLKQDATKQRKVYENQKLKMIGTLAATTAHEIKNPLTGIKGLIQLLSEKYSDSQDEMYFSIIQSEITRINDIVNEFLILGKPSVQPNEVIEIGSVLEELSPIIMAEASSHNAILNITNSKQPLYVLCVKDQLKQVILNIVKNSFESTHSNGTIFITISSENDSALITVDDNGCGMSKETLQQIFEPFYTTKDTGTGLGLFVCKRILTLFGGTLSIESTENMGTTVKTTLPLHKE